jgi:hypothetical protein
MCSADGEGHLEAIAGDKLGNQAGETRANLGAIDVQQLSRAAGVDQTACASHQRADDGSTSFITR